MTIIAKPFSPEVKAEILVKFNTLTGGVCPMGGHRNWLVVDGYSSIALQQDLKNQVIGGPNVPAATLVCNQCGFIVQIALGRIGLLIEG